MTACAVEHDLNRHMDKLDRAIVRVNRTFEILVELVAEATAPGGNYDPTDANNICEAIGEADIQVQNDIHRAMMNNDAERLMKVIRDCSEAYWTYYARSVLQHKAEQYAFDEQD